MAVKGHRLRELSVLERTTKRFPGDSRPTSHGFSRTSGLSASQIGKALPLKLWGCAWEASEVTGHHTHPVAIVCLRCPISFEDSKESQEDGSVGNGISPASPEIQVQSPEHT